MHMETYRLAQMTDKILQLMKEKKLSTGYQFYTMGLEYFELRQEEYTFIEREDTEADIE